MEIFYFKQAEQLDNFIKSVADETNDQAYGTEFLQSWAWGTILENEGAKVLRIGVRERDGRILMALTLVRKTFFGLYNYYYGPRGPVIYGKSLSTKRLILNFLLQEIRKHYPRIIFLRLEPSEVDIFSDHNFWSNRIKLRKTIDQQPAQTLLLDLQTSSEELLKAMHSKTRYNIRLATKKGLDIKEGNLQDLAEFWRLLSLTGKRDVFRLHSLGHYRNLMADNSSTDYKFIKLFFVVYKGQNIAAGLFAFYGNKVTYLHGASDSQFRNLMAPYLLQWSLIKMALQQAYKYYDFYGIDEEKWPGVTRFKLGFTGRRVKYAGTYDLIFKPFTYKIYNFFRKLRRGL